MTTHETSADDLVAAAKRTLTPAMPRMRGTFECPKCGRRQEVDGNCPDDSIPLRMLSTKH